MKPLKKLVRFLRLFRRFYITNPLQPPKIPETRDIGTTQSSDIKRTKTTPENPEPSVSPENETHRGSSPERETPILPLAKPELVVAQTPKEARIASASTPAKDSVRCIYCAGSKVVKRGRRKKKFETVQLYFCHHCKKTFVWQRVKGKRFPLRVILEGLSLYNIGYSLEESCQRVKEQFGLEVKPSTLSDWVKEFEPICRYSRLRPYGKKLFGPNQIIQSVHLYHRQVYDFSVHRAKTALLLQDYRYGKFENLREFLEAIQAECPHQFFKEGVRASEQKVNFNLNEVVLRRKNNFANRIAELTLQAVSDNKLRHKALQRFMLCNDSVTVAVEVPVYMDDMDIHHMQEELKFKIPLELDKILTGHIDILQLRNGAVHIMDYKPNAAKGKNSIAMTQLTLYALALSRLTGLRLYDFKCAWFDEKDYFEFFPLHVVYKLRERAKKESPEQMKFEEIIR